ncbi:MerR family transcriptional regulator [Enterococcus larvae]|uniref:MerR family transcriptional regulator n=1 Tax=Enterococcus larvae TaxID=2794352 RepID=UPI003F360FCC
MENMLSIGEMAELCGLSIQRLRYYSNIGLLQPDYINPTSNYRYYSVHQKQTLFLIQTLQYLGLSLREISDFISKNQADKQTSEKIDHYIQQEEAKLIRIKTITSILFEGHNFASQPDFFSTIEIECADRSQAFAFGRDWRAASKYFRNELIKRNISLSYLFFCGIKQQLINGEKKYFYYIELPGVFVENTKRKSYSDYEEAFCSDASSLDFSTAHEVSYFLRLPEVDKKKSYRILHLKSILFKAI